MFSSPYFTIPAGQPFAHDLAQGILDLCPTADELARAHLLLPSHRMVKTLRDAFLQKLDGTPKLLPKMQAIGDLDADEPLLLSVADDKSVGLPPAISPLERQFLLARQIRQFPIGGQFPSAAQALALAQSLARLIDQMHGAGTPIETLETILPDDLAQHWQDIYQFLKIVMHHWPRVLAARGQLDPADRHRQLIGLQIAAWQAAPPAHLVILAGSTGSLQGTRDLMQAVANLPKGAVVFPGLEAGDERLFANLEAIQNAPTHPLSMLADTLAALSCTADQIQLWPGCQEDRLSASAPVRHFFKEVFRPAEQTAQWRRLREGDVDEGQTSDQISDQSSGQRIDRRAVAGLQRMTAASDHEEAALIATLMREVLEVPEKTAMLITPDRGLAQLVQTALSRWGIEVDDSAGQPLSSTSPGRLLRLLAELPGADSPPQALLNLLKHPLICAGLERGAFLAKLRQLELGILRGVLAERGFDGIEKMASAHPQLAEFYQTHILRPLRPLFAVCSADMANLKQLAQALAETAEALCATPDDPSGTQRLYAGDAGMATAQMLADLIDCETDYLIEIADFGQSITQLSQTVSVRSAHRKHPRLAILGTVEARMQRADRVILAGLNEAIWPPVNTADFWMNSQARQTLNLPNSYWRAGLAAHDFMMAASHDDVILTRALRVNDTPTRPSRFLSRLEAVLAATSLSVHLPDKIPDWLLACLAADKAGKVQPVSAPAPKPPLSLRPRRFSATEFDMWITDPYGLYAKRILGLKALDPVDERPGPALRGTLIHNVLAQLSTETISAEQALEALLGSWSGQPVIGGFWGQRIEAILRWFTAEHEGRLTGSAAILVEETGEIHIQMPEGAVAVRARADRIEITRDGGLRVIDFKTGKPPSARQVKAGRKTQLLIESLIAGQGGFAGTKSNAPIHSLEYWEVTGKPDKPATIHQVQPDDFDMTKLAGQLKQLLALYDDPDMAYLSEPNPFARPDFSDVRHLARVREWRATEVDDD